MSELDGSCDLAVITQFWLIRHAPVPGYAGRTYDHEHVPADVSNTQALRALAMRVPTDAVWMTSPLVRARQTAAAIQEQMPEDARPANPMIEVAGMTEMSMGILAGQTYHDFQTLLSAEEYARFCHQPALFTPPDGESFTDVCQRVTTCMAEMLMSHAGQNIVLVAHAGPIRAVLALALDALPARALSFGVDPLSLTRLEHIADDSSAGQWRIVCVNQEAGLS